MTIQLIQAQIRSSTRIRLAFTGVLAAGAYVTSPYVVTSVTTGTSYDLSAAIQVSSNNSSVELALASPLPTGQSFQVACTAVPGADASTFTGTQSAFFGPNVVSFPNVEPFVDNADLALFKRDLVWAGDYIESADGDLVTTSGLPNVAGALQRRVDEYALPWNNQYGAKLLDFVDGAPQGAGSAKANISAQVLADDRVKSATVTLAVQDNGDAAFTIVPVLLGNRKPAPFTKNVTGNA